MDELKTIILSGLEDARDEMAEKRCALMLDTEHRIIYENAFKSGWIEALLAVVEIIDKSNKESGR